MNHSSERLAERLDSLGWSEIILGRLAEDAPLSWSEVECLLPRITREKAKQYLQNGASLHSADARMYELLFTLRPELQEDLEPPRKQKSLPMWELQKMSSSGSGETVFARSDRRGEAFLSVAPEGPENVRATFLKMPSHGGLKLYAEGARATPLQPFQGNSTLFRASDLHSVLHGDAALLLTVTLRVLVADDNPDFQELMKELLYPKGIQPDFESDADSACNRAIAAHQAGEPYDLILFDLFMPEKPHSEIGSVGGVAQSRLAPHYENQLRIISGNVEKTRSDFEFPEAVYPKETPVLMGLIPQVAL